MKGAEDDFEGALDDLRAHEMSGVRVRWRKGAVALGSGGLGRGGVRAWWRKGVVEGWHKVVERKCVVV